MGKRSFESEVLLKGTRETFFSPEDCRFTDGDRHARKTAIFLEALWELQKCFADQKHRSFPKSANPVAVRGMLGTVSAQDLCPPGFL